MEFPVDGPQRQERQEYATRVYLAEASVGRSPRVVWRSNDGGQSDLSRRINCFKIEQPAREDGLDRGSCRENAHIRNASI